MASELGHKHPHLTLFPPSQLLLLPPTGQTLVERGDKGAPRCMSASWGQRRMEKQEGAPSGVPPTLQREAAQHTGTL